MPPIVVFANWALSSCEAECGESLGRIELFWVSGKLRSSKGLDLFRGQSLDGVSVLICHFLVKLIVCVLKVSFLLIYNLSLHGLLKNHFIDQNRLIKF